MDYSSPEWFESLTWQHRWIGYMVGWWVGQFGLPKTVLDLGAGDGWWGKCFHDMGSDVWAVELHEIAREYIPDSVMFMQHDLREPVSFGRTYDLVICLEVGEHLPRPAGNVLGITLAQHTGQNLLFSAATPGQEGTGHVNLQPHAWWRGRIEKQWLEFSPLKTGMTRQAFGNIVNEWFRFLPNNLQVFSKTR